MNELFYSRDRSANMDIRKIFASNVRKYRLKKELSQEQLAHITGLHRTYISDIERCIRSISLDNIQKIANGLDVPIYKLFISEACDIKWAGENHTVR